MGSRILSSDPRGAAYLFYGPISGALSVSDADATFYEKDEDLKGEGVGRSVVGLGDTDGDGFDDLLVATMGWGADYIFRGGPR